MIRAIYITYIIIITKMMKIKILNSMQCARSYLQVVIILFQTVLSFLWP